MPLPTLHKWFCSSHPLQEVVLPDTNWFSALKTFRPKFKFVDRKNPYPEIFLRNDSTQAPSSDGKQNAKENPVRIPNRGIRDQWADFSSEDEDESQPTTSTAPSSTATTRPSEYEQAHQRSRSCSPPPLSSRIHDKHSYKLACMIAGIDLKQVVYRNISENYSSTDRWVQKRRPRVYAYMRTIPTTRHSNPSASRTDRSNGTTGQADQVDERSVTADTPILGMKAPLAKLLC